MENESKKRVAIFGGSFDPPHLGHVAIVKKALETLPVEKIVVMPAHISPFKKGHAASAALRLAWLEKLFAAEPRVEVSNLEVRKGGPSYTVDTVERLGRDFDTIYLIIGADNLEGLTRWHRFGDLDKMVRWVVATRDERPIPEGYIRLEVKMPVSSTQLRERIDPAWIPEAIRDEVVAYYRSAAHGETRTKTNETRNKESD
jgi:nicotinate-nucleotide adenylyltransferase